MANVIAIILAAGKGTRMKSDLVKVMHPVGGQPMICWPVEVAREAGAEKVVLVTGHQSETVREFFANAPDIVFALQEEQLGTGHAVACAREACAGFGGTVVILSGDVPLLRAETVQAMVAHHEERAAAVTVLTTQVCDPFGYGRIVKREGGRILRIVEEKDATEEERGITEINAGIYCVNAAFLFDAVTRLDNRNRQGEYYLTDIVKAASEQNELCVSFSVSDADEVMGVNDRVQLAQAASVVRGRINRDLMLSGITIVDPATAYIEKQVSIGRDTTIHPNVHISGNTIIGAGCVIEPGAVIRACTIGKGVTVKTGTVMTDSVLHDEVSVGPMAHLRPGTVLHSHVKIGNFVETKKIEMGEGSKASHLTYLGDATIGSDVNVGCGTITCNYDGVRKHRTVIGDGVFVGSDVQFVAPVTIGCNSLIAAGTTVTKDVPPDSLAIARSPQVNKEGWKLKKK
ncbi:bifunctional UDP-N-acetylglucosamine diphosphorylase/glucosamine-1-phosphate N-acetyltransferase GlmU [Geobacter sp. DSM 9736]|uniref:bifunctional UDP-N-acetylglucosamine diphosphorylase/glucosamine-1-phosphate N-acetyltransferase GlmU n=1 Tax=Geobacter sp. DSM 9736 TaxID=1277350 RepID=UPI000B505A7F|nr:bifunctional UDP-N-acetylglucosamine diphosphorylase/glucosamine-1-phosphate N-acetyltransferase GlmU [Geobacter sp. DSM 9736]SNB47658.1 bifunctional UDP-N-acetylglucosamine pyrophosphorylase / Glucosamine-1-phosphate N-acetyltransferase [Geobacter sp. DSM 9736]